MTTIDCELIRNNRRRTIALLDVDGQPGKIDIVRNGRDGWSGIFRVMVKLRGEREFRLVSLNDNMSREHIRPIVEDRIHAEYVTKWMDDYC